MSGHRLETQLIHAGEPEPKILGAATLPIFQSTVFELHDVESYHDIRYPRLTNLPNHRALAAKLAALEGGEAAVVTASGMAAIATTLLTVLEGSGHILVQAGVYGGSHCLVTQDLPGMGITHTFVDGADPAGWEAALTPATRAVYTEAITNPLMQVTDHRAAVAFARAHGLIAIIDNTFATPVNFRPLALGYDLALHSATKYLNGHSDLAAGALVGHAALVDRIKRRLDHLGGCLDPHACYLLSRGLKTLALRVRQQNESTLAIARHLDARAEVTRVNYPGLPAHPQHALATELFAGCGGMLSFELEGGPRAAERLIDRLDLFLHAPSLGGPESLVTRPATTSHRNLRPEERQRLGISDGLVRMSVGIEHPDDLLADLDQAFGA